MPQKPQPSKNLNDVSYEVIHNLCGVLDTNQEWRNLVATVCKEERYEFKDYQVEEIARELYRPHGSPAHKLLQQLGIRGMSVRELIRFLTMMRNERALCIIQESEPLHVVEQPQHVTVTEGSSFKLACRAGGFPFPCYQWFRGKIKLEGETQETLSVDEADMSHNGKYICRIHNSRSTYENNLIEWSDWCRVDVVSQYDPYTPVKKPAENEFRQNYLYAPYIEVEPEDVQVTFGETLEIKCIVRGNPTPICQWTKDNNILPDQTEPTLVIKSSTLPDKGKYQLKASNSQGEVCSKVAEAIINDTPASEKPVITCEYGNMEVPEGTTVVLSIRVKCKVRFECQWFCNTEPIEGATTTQYSFCGQKHKSGMYQCIVTTVAGKSQPSHPAQITITERPLYNPTGKVALLIGIKDYSNYFTLPAAKKDVLKFKEILEKMGFLVLPLINLDRTAMMNSIHMFCNMLKQHMYGVFYFAGHGFEDDRQQLWLVPADAHHSMTDVSDSISVDYIISLIQNKHPDLCLMVLDVCRQRTREKQVESRANIVPHVQARGNLCIYYATSQGQKAYEEKDGTHGIFMNNLSKVLRPEKRVTLLQLFDNLQTVLSEDQAAKDIQIPELRTNLQQFRRTLHDPVVHHGHTEEVNKTLVLWRMALRCPPDVEFNISGHKVDIKFSYVVSNVMIMTISGRQGAKVHNNSMWRLADINVPPDISAELKLTDHTDKLYIMELSHLENLKSDLKVRLVVVVTAPGEPDRPHRLTLPLGLPLVSQMSLWKPYDIDGTLQQLPMSIKLPVEHGEKAETSA